MKSSPIIALVLSVSLVSPSAAQTRAAVVGRMPAGVPTVPVLTGLQSPLSPSLSGGLSAPSLVLGAAPLAAPSPVAVAAPAALAVVAPAAARPASPLIKTAAIVPARALAAVLPAASNAAAPSPSGPVAPSALRAEGEAFWSGAASKDALADSMPVSAPAVLSPSPAGLKKPSPAAKLAGAALLPVAAALPEWASSVMPYAQGIGALAGAYGLIRLSNWAIDKFAARRNWDRNAIVLARFAASAVLWTSGAGVAFFTLGQPVLALMTAGTGALTLANALAPTIKDHAGNMFQFVHFILSRPFTIGDKVTIGDDTGILHDLTLRYMVLKDEKTGEFILRTYTQVAAASVVLYGEYLNKELRLKLRKPSLPHGLLRALRDAASKSLWKPILWSAAAIAALSFFPMLAVGLKASSFSWIAVALPYAKALVVATLTNSIARSLKAALERLSLRYSWTRPMTTLLKLGATSLTWLIGGSFALSAAGLSLTALGATFLIPTVFVGYIINDHLSAVFQGAILLKLRPFSIGDKVSLGKNAGEVVDVTLQHVVIKLDGERFMLIPHAVVKESAIRTPREYGGLSKP